MKVFVAVEGIDGAGKSCLAKALATYYREKGKKVWHTGEPWEESTTGRQLREFLHNKRNKADKTEGVQERSLKLAEKFIANRKEHSQEIGKRLDKKEVVLCERYDISTYAYQTIEFEDNQIDHFFSQLHKMHDYGFETGCVEPKATLYLRIPAKVALERIAQRLALYGKRLERYENKDNLSMAVKRYDAAMDFLRAIEEKENAVKTTATSSRPFPGKNDTGSLTSNQTTNGRLFLQLDAQQDKKKIFEQAISFLSANNLSADNL